MVTRFVNIDASGVGAPVSLIGSTAANSITGGVFTVLTSANLSLPRTNWTALATNVANSATFRFTNGLNPAAPAQFYLFQEK